MFETVPKWDVQTHVRPKVQARVQAHVQAHVQARVYTQRLKTVFLRFQLEEELQNQQLIGAEAMLQLQSLHRQKCDELSESLEAECARANDAETSLQLQCFRVEKLAEELKSAQDLLASQFTQV